MKHSECLAGSKRAGCGARPLHGSSVFPEHQTAPPFPKCAWLTPGIPQHTRYLQPPASLSYRQGPLLYPPHWVVRIFPCGQEHGKVRDRICLIMVSPVASRSHRERSLPPLGTKWDQSRVTCLTPLILLVFPHNHNRWIGSLYFTYKEMETQRDGKWDSSSVVEPGLEPDASDPSSTAWTFQGYGMTLKVILATFIIYLLIQVL